MSGQVCIVMPKEKLQLQHPWQCLVVKENILDLGAKMILVILEGVHIIPRLGLNAIPDATGTLTKIALIMTSRCYRINDLFYTINIILHFII